MLTNLPTTTDRINSAVQSGVESCFGTTDILPKLAGFLDGLRVAGWDKTEVHTVELACLEILFRIIVARDKTGADVGRESELSKVHGI